MSPCYLPVQYCLKFQHFNLWSGLQNTTPHKTYKKKEKISKSNHQTQIKKINSKSVTDTSLSSIEASLGKRFKFKVYSNSYLEKLAYNWAIIVEMGQH